jgi:hypothetical protein
MPNDTLPPAAAVPLRAPPVNGAAAVAARIARGEHEIDVYGPLAFARVARSWGRMLGWSIAHKGAAGRRHMAGRYKWMH